MIIFLFSIFTSSFLLFQIQPMIGKYILPWFGSSPAVWSASLLFFQVLLFFGYAYAYTIVEKFSFRQQGKIHFVVILVSILYLFVVNYHWPAPILPDPSFQPVVGGNPFWQVLWTLAISVGIPFFLLATNSTLMQSWYYQIFSNRSPYRLYALSNFASLLGLLSYPIFFELYLTLIEQARIWSLLFCFFAFFVIVIALKRKKYKPEDRINNLVNHFQDPLVSDKPGTMNYILWFLLAMIASILLLAVTNQITQEVAVIPFLWVLPLSLYLISFIFCFEGNNWYGRKRFNFVLTISIMTYWIMIGKGPTVGIQIQIATYCLLLFVCCMICHGELVNLRPGPDRLTSFYLVISIGGAAGGIFVNLIAPLLFQQYQELFIGLISCSAIYFWITIFIKREKIRWKLAVSLFSLISIFIVVVVITVQDYQAVKRGTLWSERNFFGVLRIKEKTFEPNNEVANELIHGITIHGLQFLDDDWRKLTTTYYTETSGVGLAYEELSSRGPLKVGVLGLGVGTISAYGNPGDTIRFYEINPAVIEIAQGAGNYFSFLKDSEANIEIVVGDARLSLEKELENYGSQQYNLLVLDTFNSDAIPIHLLTFEAFDLYLDHIVSTGVLAVHISNNHLDLKPVVFGLAKAHNLSPMLVTSGKTRLGSSASVWILLTYDREFIKQPLISKYAFQMENYPTKYRLWTDNYSNMFQILK